MKILEDKCWKTANESYGYWYWLIVLSWGNCSMIYGLILTLCIYGECHETVPQSFYSMDDCTQALQELDRTYPNSFDLFRCEAIED